jgi:hypothetical protein
MLLAVLHVGIEAVLAIGHNDSQSTILRIALNARLATPTGVIAVHAVKQINSANLLARAVLRDNDIEASILIQRRRTKYTFK